MVVCNSVGGLAGLVLANKVCTNPCSTAQCRPLSCQLTQHLFLTIHISILYFKKYTYQAQFPQHKQQAVRHKPVVIS